MLRVTLLAGQEVGREALRTLTELDVSGRVMVAYDAETILWGRRYEWFVYRTISHPAIRIALAASDIVISVHGREIVSDELLALPRHGGLNLHPCLYGYPGPDPIGRWLQSGELWASVGAHRMTAQVDRGPRIYEESIKIIDRTDRASVYRQLAPIYERVLRIALNRMCVWETVDAQC